MAGLGQTRMRSRRNTPNPHLVHVALHPLAVDGMAFPLQLRGDATRPVEGALGIDFVDPVLERPLHRPRPDGPVIQARAVEAQQCGLRGQRQRIRSPIEQRLPLSAGEGRGQIFFEPLDLGRELANLGIELRHFLVVGLGLLFDRLGFREKMDKVVEGLAFPPVELTRMDLVFSRNLRDRLLFLKHLQHHLSFERRGMMFLFWHDVSSVTLEALKTCLVFGDHYTVPHGILPPATVGYDPTLAEYDVTRDSKSASLQGLRLDLLTRPSPISSDLWATAIADALRPLGASLSVHPLSVGDTITRMRDGNFDLAQLGFQIGPEPFSFFRDVFSTHGPANLTGFQSDEVDRLVQEARLVGQESDRRQVYAAIQRIVLDEVPIIGTRHGYAIIASRVERPVPLRPHPDGMVIVERGNWS